MSVAEDPLRVLVEGREVARARDGEAAHGDAADAIGAFRVLVLPAHVVAGAGRQDVDLVLRREALRDEAAQVLGSAEHFGAIALDDEC